MSGLREVLASRGLDLTARIKVVRHQDKRRDLFALEMDAQRFDEWQKYQSRAIFDCDYIVSFIGLPRSRARFYGVFRVGECMPATKRPSEFAGPGNWYYELERVPAFDDLKGRLIIEWDGVATSWHRWLDEAHDKKVVEILPQD